MKNVIGFSLIEVLLAVSLLALLVTGLSGAYLYADLSESDRRSYLQAQALALEGQDVTRFIRDNDAAQIVPGTYGINASASSWSFTASSDVTNGFERSVSLSSTNATTTEVVSTTQWNDVFQRARSLELYSVITNWQEQVVLAGEIVYDFSQQRLRQQGRRLQAIRFRNTSTIDLTLTGMIVSWSGSSASYITEVRIGGNPVEYTCQTPPTCPGSGTVILLNPYQINAGRQRTINRVQFDSSFAGSTYTITLIDSLGNQYLSQSSSI